MKTRKKQLYHGAALTQIVDHEAFSSLSRLNRDYGRYELNGQTRLVVKYLSAKTGPWRFVFQKDEVQRIVDDSDDVGPDRIFVILVCGPTTICALKFEEAAELIDPNADDYQSVIVKAPPGKSMRVSGDRSALRHTVPHSRFPGIVMS